MIKAVRVLDNVLHEPETGWKGQGEGVSLFYAMSPSVSRARYLSVLDELAAAGIDFTRFAGSTFTWDNPVKMRNVIPFKPGNYYTHNEGVDKGVSVDPVFNPEHGAELCWRLDEAAKRGVRVQYTIFWGGTRALFTTDRGREVRYDAVRPYVKDIARLFEPRPEHILEIINEANHGHHLARVERAGRIEFIEKCSRWIRQAHPNAVITVSDGGSTKFDYIGAGGIDYWNIHWDRTALESQGIPKWCRGSWHLWETRPEWRHEYKKGGYGRSDENIFLSTEAEHQKWSYEAGTRDQKMYALMMWVTRIAGAGLTFHTHKGFFCEQGVTTDLIFFALAVLRSVTSGFNWHNSEPKNTSWTGSPVKDWEGDTFKCYTLLAADKKDVLFVVLNPREGTLVLGLEHALTARIYDPIGGALLMTQECPPGESRLKLPEAPYKHGLVGRLSEKPPGPPPPPPPLPPPSVVHYDIAIEWAYQTFHGRPLDPSGQRHFNKKLREGFTVSEMIEEIIRSPEFERENSD